MKIFEVMSSSKKTHLMKNNVPFVRNFLLAKQAIYVVFNAIKIKEIFCFMTSS